jgi:hypothetical protein
VVDLDEQQVAVLLDEVDAAVVADRVGQQRAREML